MKELLLGLGVVLGFLLAIAAPAIAIQSLDYGLVTDGEKAVAVVAWVTVAAEIVTVAYVIGYTLIG